MDSPAPLATPSTQPAASTSTGSAGGLAGDSKKRSSGARPKHSCSDCRRLKLKCTGTFPCPNCVRRNTSATCPEGATDRPYSRQTRTLTDLHALASRVEELEAILREQGLGDRVPAPLQLRSELAVNATASPVLGSSNPPSGGVSGRAPESTSSSSGKGKEPAKDANGRDLDVLATGVGSLSLKDDGSIRFLGTSAGAAYFMEDSQRPAEARSTSAPLPDAPPSFFEGSFGAFGTQSQHSMDSDSPASAITGFSGFPFSAPGYFVNGAPPPSLEAIRAVLPDRAEGLRLSHNYFGHVSFMFEPIDAETYFSDYLPTAYDSREPGSGPKLAVVLAVITLGTMFDREGGDEFREQSKRYLVASQSALCASNFLCVTTVASVQALHLYGNFFFNQPNIQESGDTFFPILGIAIRIAISCGLHRDPEAWDLPEEESNLRRLVFHELLVLDRLQSFISGRPYGIFPTQHDTKHPTNASQLAIWKYNLGDLIGRYIDAIFSVQPPSYTTLMGLTQDLRDLYNDSPESTKCRVMPANALSRSPAPPEAPSAPPQVKPDLRTDMQQHTLALLFVEVLLYTHKVPFAQALKEYQEEPLKAPWAASVSVTILEAAPLVLKLASSWIDLDVLCPRWWHVSFHSFAATVAMSSLIVTSPRSMLVSHAWRQLHVAYEFFKRAASFGGPASMLFPRVVALRTNAAEALQALMPSSITLMATDGEEAERDKRPSSLGIATKLYRETKSSASPVPTPLRREGDGSMSPPEPVAPVQPGQYNGHPYATSQPAESSVRLSQSMPTSQQPHRMIYPDLLDANRRLLAQAQAQQQGMHQGGLVPARSSPLEAAPAPMPFPGPAFYAEQNQLLHPFNGPNYHFTHTAQQQQPAHAHLPPADTAFPAHHLVTTQPSSAADKFLQDHEQYYRESVAPQVEYSQNASSSWEAWRQLNPQPDQHQ